LLKNVGEIDYRGMEVEELPFEIEIEVHFRFSPLPATFDRQQIFEAEEEF
jgi:hypothetical protein